MLKPLTTLSLAPLSAAYGAVMRVRSEMYRAGVLQTRRVGAPVISVGNLTVGGTGKTPMVEWLARAAAGENRHVCVLTRGYGRTDARRRVVVSDGQQLLAEARSGGDEPRELAERLLNAGVAVISDADRAGAAGWARRHLGSDAFVLDDGFQHLRLWRDLDLVLLDATRPWGGGYLLPRGRLREPLVGLRRADAVIITRAELADDLDALRRKAARLSGGRPIFTAHTRTVRLRPLLSAPVDEADATLPMQPFAAFCAVGNPQAFFAHAMGDGLALSNTRAFHDHHAYTQGDVDSCVREARRNGAHALLTTAKDAVKLHGMSFALPCFVLEIEFTVDESAALLSLLRRALASG